MNIPDWLNDLKNNDELVVYYPYSGNTHYVKFVEYILPTFPSSKINKAQGVKVCFEKNDQIVDQYLKYDFLHYEDYSNSPQEKRNWIAYPVVK